MTVAASGAREEFPWGRWALLAVLTIMTCGRAARAEAAPELPAAQTLFAVGAYRVSGNSLVSDAEARLLLAPFTGADSDFDTIRQAMAALRAAYAAKGFRGVTVALPEQELDGGEVRIVVTEPTLEAVAVDGASHFDALRVRGFFPMLAEGAPVDFDRLGRALDVINDNPALKTMVEFFPGATEARRGARIVVQDAEPRAAFAAFDNSGTHATGKGRWTLGARHADIAGHGDMLTAQYTTSLEKPGDVSIWGAGYRLPVPAAGAAIDVYAGHSNVNSGTVGGLFNVSGKGTVGGIKATWQLDRVGALRQQVVAGIDYRAFGNSVVPLGGGQSLVPDYTVHPLGVGYLFTQGDSGGAVTLVHGFPGGAHADDATLDQARIGARARYTALRYAGNLGFALGGGWTAGLALGGQYARVPLTPGEQFGLGGAQSVRGFDERHVAGDSGHRGAAEIRGAPAALGDARIVGIGFVEWGRLRRNRAQPGELAVESIASWGMGARIALGARASCAIDAARVLRGTATHANGSGRVHVSLLVTF